MRLKLAALGVFGVLGIALIYPGIPVGGGMLTISSASGGVTTITCYSLRWNGVNRRDIRIEHPKGSDIHVTNAACRTWSQR